MPDASCILSRNAFSASTWAGSAGCKLQPPPSLQDAQPEPKKGQPAPPPPTVIKCVVLDGEVIDVYKWKTLEKIPTKEELLTKIAVGIKANPRKIALGVKAIPSKIAYGVKALSELNDDKSMTVEAAAAAKKESS
jgi:hypothetical protein